MNEQLSVMPDTTPLSFTRSAAAERYDDVSGVSALLDGRVVGTQRAIGTGSAWIEKIGRGPGIDVTWTLPPGQSTKPFVLGLRYRAVGAMEVSGVNGVLWWRALPAGRSFDVT